MLFHSSVKTIQNHLEKYTGAYTTVAVQKKKKESFIIYFIGDVMTSSLLLIDGITDLVFTSLPLSSVGHRAAS